MYFVSSSHLILRIWPGFLDSSNRRLRNSLPWLLETQLLVIRLLLLSKFCLKEIILYLILKITLSIFDISKFSGVPLLVQPALHPPRLLALSDLQHPEVLWADHQVLFYEEKQKQNITCLLSEHHPERFWANHHVVCYLDLVSVWMSAVACGMITAMFMEYFWWQRYG